MRQFVRVMKALSDPSRVKILKMLGVKEFCVCELRELLGLAQPTVSKHLKILEDAGLVTYRKEGVWIIYRLTDGSDTVYSEAMLAHLQTWLDDDPIIQEMISRLPQINRERSCAA